MAQQSTISNAISTGHGNAVLYAAAIGLVLSDIIPTPGDALYFYQQRKLKNNLQAGKISAKKYWATDAMGYYLYNSLWWALVLVSIIFTKGDFSKKSKVGLAFLGGGAVIAVLLNNIKKDEQIENQNAKNNT